MGSQDGSTDTWLITMVIVSPQILGLWDSFQTAFPQLINGGDPNQNLNGMILQVQVDFCLLCLYCP